MSVRTAHFFERYTNTSRRYQMQLCTYSYIYIQHFYLFPPGQDLKHTYAHTQPVLRFCCFTVTMFSLQYYSKLYIIKYSASKAMNSATLCFASKIIVSAKCAHRICVTCSLLGCLCKHKVASKIQLIRCNLINYILGICSRHNILLLINIFSFPLMYKASNGN